MISRRHFLRTTGALLAGGVGLRTAPRAAERADGVRFGLITDLHYADIPPRGTRQCRKSVAKLAECVATMNEQGADFLVELGDFKDQDTPPVEANTLRYLDTIEAVFRRFRGPRYHVLGNHDTDSLSKARFLAHVENSGIAPGESCYGFTVGGARFLVLDANYRADGSDYDRGNFDWTQAWLPPKELAWLRRELAAAQAPVVVFVHQPLDGYGPHTVRNAAEVRQILRASRKVVAVFQGHNHAGGYHCLDGIHYCTLKAAVEGEDNAYALVELMPDGRITVTGYHRAVSRKLAPPAFLAF
jgi:predicted phosphodiesterase